MEKGVSTHVALMFLSLVVVDVDYTSHEFFNPSKGL